WLDWMETSPCHLNSLVPYLEILVHTKMVQNFKQHSTSKSVIISFIFARVLEFMQRY
ncbi:hypothetical protein ACJX0J_033722, partial [Zea mays]